MIKNIQYFILIAVVTLIELNSLNAQSSYISKVWVSDNGDGTYKNPVLNADYSDPDVIRVGDDFYMTASSFNCTPGLPILHSRDMINWSIINHALKKQIPEESFNTPQQGKGVWAPSFAYHNNELYIYYPDPDYGIYMIKTKDPAGEWSRPVMVLSGKGIIDPSVFWDDDGKAYLSVAWAASRAGVNSLLTVFKMNREGTSVIDEGKHIYDGHGMDHTVEGPKFYKRNGYYYILCPAGGVATGWQLALRSKNIFGPYERKVVMVQGNTGINGPHQGALVQTPKGSDWFFHFQDKGAYGRVVHLQPVQWKNDWPVIGDDKDGDGTGVPVMQFKKPDIGNVYPTQTPAESDEFNNDGLGLQWQWQGNPKIQWSALIRKSGFLRLFAVPSDTGRNLWSVPNLLLQKFPAPSFTATVKIKWNIEWDVYQNKKAGLIIMGDDYAYLDIHKTDKGFFVTQVICNDAVGGGPERTIETRALKDSVVYLSVHVGAPDANCVFSYSDDGVRFNNIGVPFKARPVKWTGAKIGLFSVATPKERIGGYADVDWFRITK
ncbi:glycoside hydrolase family 43 protein [Niabella soli]|uniref:Glycoside hydrolase n=1 Tax=Niabella soli DSM 19437 TaxID=929713 RepID=W0F6I2_9BACT|nr:glycoside hydrolase 43 family protein [Niabella soli]AHF16966.1 glycoside hydrolase [Niabella soli DSM 19437]